jgi:hypothetical protein
VVHMTFRELALLSFRSLVVIILTNISLLLLSTLVMTGTEIGNFWMLDVELYPSRPGGSSNLNTCHYTYSNLGISQVVYNRHASTSGECPTTALRSIH